MLCGTHPEMPTEVLTSSVHLYDGAQAKHVAALGLELAAWEVERRRLWGLLLLACCTASVASEGSSEVAAATVAAVCGSMRARAGGDERAELAAAAVSVG